MRTLVDRPRRTDEAGVELTLMVLSVSALGLAAVDLASGAVVRTGSEILDSITLCPYDVVSARLAAGAEPLDPTQPEAVALADAPVPLRRLTPRRAERWLRPLHHPEWTHLLGFAGPSIPFWQLDGTRPSVAVVPARATVRLDDGLLRCRFLWRTLVHDLPVAFRRGTPLPNEAGRVVVALTPPFEGHCHKVVTGLL
ncbi:MAG: hypothetical protein AVDCRST_MAG76-3372 [uncultured Acidimicrobiales bacterium]|uniref:Uncharacterized protein n=1 Tax=uncultured Acidimicrobiales bacterium TaxID=310071 RepID=A0A6J4J539_9ACTN|nr:MAG: hypothetical protein AVDCRST_MAG76-3372 [uncultured Acidimicrobiales bacterium]